MTRAPLPRLERRNPAGPLARVSPFSRDGIIPTQEPSPSPSATSVPRTCTSCLGARLAVFAGAFTSLQLEPHRFLKCRELWRSLMQCSFGTSPGGNDETVCLVYSVVSHVPEEDDARNVDIRNVRASNASEPSLQAMARADLGFNRSTKSRPLRMISLTPIPVRSCHRGHLAEAAELRRGLRAQAIHEHPSTP